MKASKTIGDQVTTATLTFHNANNYGALAQTFALQKALENLGFENTIINYTSPYMAKPYGYSALKRKGLIRYILGIAYSVVRFPRKNNFEKMRGELKISKPLTPNELVLLEDRFQYFIVGSDQVWNDDINNFDPAYFLDFIKSSHKKKSYAASFGFEKMPDDKKVAYQDLLSTFSTINVREQSGANIINELLARLATLSLDPTLLLSQKEWNSIAITPKIKEKYILVYQLTFSSKLIAEVKKISQKKGWKIVTLPFPLGGFLKSRMNLTAGPKEWVGLIASAEMVITDSFHGCVFSIIYNKPFRVVKTAGFTRIENLLTMFGLEGCIVDGSEDSHDLNWGLVNKKVEDKRTESLLNIKNMLPKDSI